jgi:hypothetical protein
MSRLVSELEALLNELIVEHQRLLKHLQTQQVAMKSCDLKVMDTTSNSQEASRLRIATLEAKRRMAVAQLTKTQSARMDLTLTEIAALYPHQGPALLRQRAVLKDLMKQVSARAQVAGKVAGAVLGHLNTVVRLLAGAVEKAGLYTKQGIPQVSSRIGVMEAVG